MGVNIQWRSFRWAGLLLVCGCNNQVSAPLEPDVTIEPRYGIDGRGLCQARGNPVRRLSRYEYRNTLESLFSALDLSFLQVAADPELLGYDNHVAALQPTGILIENYMSNAQEIAAAVAHAALAEATAGMSCTGGGHVSCARAFLEYWAPRIFRRPVSDVDHLLVFFSQAPGDTDLQAGSALALQAMLQSPEFLYRLETVSQSGNNADSAPLDAYSLANRLSYMLWATMPDAVLFAAAADGSLLSDKGLLLQIDRMLEAPQSRQGILHFYQQWLHLEKIYEATKLEEDNLTTELREAMHEETLRLVEHLVFGSEGSLDDLLTVPRTFVNPALAQLYGVDHSGETTWELVDLDPNERAGILTHGAFLASHGHAYYPSPILRGVFVLERIMCRPLGAPPPEAEGAAPGTSDDGEQTNRQRYDAATLSTASCASCHKVINAAGYAFESYDTMGRFRTHESNGLPVDTTGQLFGRNYSDALDFVQGLAIDPEVETCLTEQYLRYAYGNDATGTDPCLVEDIAELFGASGGQLRELIVAVATHPAFRTHYLEENAP